MIYAPFADLEMSFPSCIIQSGFTVYPALDSIIMMSCVSEYGRALKSESIGDLVTGKLRRKNASVVNSGVGDESVS